MAEEVNIRSEEPQPPARGTYEMEERKRVSWPAIWAGVVVAFGVEILFVTFGLFIGFVGWNPITGAGGGPWGFAWNIVSGFFAVLFGAMAATRLSGNPDRDIARLHGVATWGLYTGFLALFVGYAITSGMQALAPVLAAVAAPAAAPAAQAAAAQATGVAHALWMFWLTAWLGVVGGLIGAFVGARIGRPKGLEARGEVTPEWRRAA